MKRNILITGGAGFIGSHVVRLFVGKYPDYRIVNLDRLTYAGNLANLRDVENRPNYTFVKGDICDYDAMRSLFAEYDIDGVIHLAAESHVDRSIRDPFTFARTNVMGTLTLLQADGSIGTAHGKADASTTSRPTRSTGRCRSTGRSSPSRPATTPTRPTRRRKPRRTISYGRSTTRTDSRPW